ncbi:MAG: hypothetical protein Q4B96_03390 [Bacillota bacterium]|nr:hypothetical protein [Bacillota bacterium]
MALSILYFSYFWEGIILFFLINALGKNMRECGISRMEYAIFSFADTESVSFGLNIRLRVFLPSIYMLILANIYNVKFQTTPHLIFLMVIWYYVFRWFYIFYILRRKELVNIKSEITVAIIGSALACIIYNALIASSVNIWVSWEDIKTELWLIVIFFVYELLKTNIDQKIITDEEKSRNRKLAYIKNKYHRLSQKYDNYIIPDNKYDFYYPLVYAIMIYEDYCRPNATRLCERIWAIYKLKIKKQKMSLGIMQFTTHTIITDDKSVQLAVEMIKDEIATYCSDPDNYTNETSDKYMKCINKHSCVRTVLEKYNDGENYKDEVLYIFDRINDILGKSVDLDEDIIISYDDNGAFNTEKELDIDACCAEYCEQIPTSSNRETM